MTTKSTQQIGKELLKLRLSNGLTQEKLRIKSGLTPTQIVDIEKGRRNIKINTLFAYLKAVKGEFIIRKRK